MITRKRAVMIPIIASPTARRMNASTDDGMGYPDATTMGKTANPVKKVMATRAIPGIDSEEVMGDTRNNAYIRTKMRKNKGAFVAIVSITIIPPFVVSAE
jgi:hypothetical protein